MNKTQTFAQADDSQRSPLLSIQSISKTFGATRALNKVSFDLFEGEIHCLVGENGAGKSTLIKILSGSLQGDEGVVAIDGSPIQINSPLEGLRQGIGVVYQELELVPELTVKENIFLGNEPTGRFSNISWGQMYEKSAEVLERLNLDLSPDQVVKNLSVAHAQLVAIGKVLSTNPRVLVLDEPSAVLGGKDLETLLNAVRRLREDGVGIIYISHRLNEIFDIGQRVTVLRDGESVVTSDVSDMDEEKLIRAMVGRSPDRQFPDIGAVQSEELLLEASDFGTSFLKQTNFKLHRGEILGATGLVGSGLDELAKALIGLAPSTRGELKVHGRRLGRANTRRVRSRGLMLAPADRKQDGLILNRSITENLTYSVLSRLSIGGVLKPRAIHRCAAQYRDELRIKMSSLNQKVADLSGGNQQKVVLGKVLAAQPSVLVLEEPTRGIDVGAKGEIYELIAQLAAEGRGILLISSELEEAMALSHRLMVFSEGEQTALFDPPYDSEAILRRALPAAAIEES